jgi:hypothetical protein
MNPLQQGGGSTTFDFSEDTWDSIQILQFQLWLTK